MSDIGFEYLIAKANPTNLSEYLQTNANAQTLSMQAAVRDLEFLHTKIKDHKERAQMLWNQLVSTLALKESRKSIEQSVSTKQLTQLAYVFLPLSLSTSAFGMNTVELQNTRL